MTRIFGPLSLSFALAVFGLTIYALTVYTAPRPPPSDDSWKHNYMGATVRVAGLPATVTRDVYGKAEIMLSDGRTACVDWSLVLNQINNVGVESKP